MYQPNLAVLRAWVSPHICDFSVRQIKISANPSAVYRIKLAYTEGHRGPPALIVKHIAPDWLGDPHGADREVRFYAELLPKLPTQWLRVFFAGLEAETGYRLVVMEDVSSCFWFPDPMHLWTWTELCCVMRTYAHLHVEGRHCLPPPAARDWMWTIQQRTWDREELLAKFEDLVERQVWAPLPQLERLIGTTLALEPEVTTRPVTLLHNDICPQNVGLPHNRDGLAAPVDWEMPGWGLAELDLGYLFLLPFRNTRHINRHEALNLYWTERQALEGAVPPADERNTIQWFADALWALRQIIIAHRVVLKPFPAGSAPQAYWDAMYGVLYGRLAALCREIKT
jgi:hypothetical protein